MTVTVIGVRPLSPACARVVAATIERMAPAYVLVDGPADFGHRYRELLLDHTFPIALFSHLRSPGETRTNWRPLTEFSPELVAVRSAEAAGSQVCFIDLPAWHPDPAEPVEPGPGAAALQRSLGIGTFDALWDHLVESHCGTSADAELHGRIEAFFDVVGGSRTTERDRHMATWIRAAVDKAGSKPVVVVCSGIRRRSIVTLLSEGSVGPHDWPRIPTPPAPSDSGNHLVPYSFARMISPSPWWYRQLWAHGPDRAAEDALAALVSGLRQREHPVSTTDFQNLRLQAHGLARLRGRRCPNRVDLLDAAAATLITESVPRELPWTTDTPPLSTEPHHPVVADCLTILQGNATGVLHPDAPLPGLVHHVTIVLATLDLAAGTTRLDLLNDADRERSRVLHRLRVLGIPGFVRVDGPVATRSSTTREQWTITETTTRRTALTEASAYGPTLHDAAGSVLSGRFDANPALVDTTAGVLFDAVLCGLDDVVDSSARTGIRAVSGSMDMNAMGGILALALDLWRHDDVHGTQHSPLLGRVIDAAATRIVALAMSIHADGSTDRNRIAAIVAVADARQHAADILGTDHAARLATIAADRAAPADVRGAALGTCWRDERFELTESAARSIARGQIGDWLFGLFAVARESFLDSDSGAQVLAVVDELISGFSDSDFAVALPALRQAFEHFPPREREVIAGRIVVRPTPPDTTSTATTSIGAALDARVSDVLDRIGLR